MLENPLGYCRLCDTNLDFFPHYLPPLIKLVLIAVIPENATRMHATHLHRKPFNCLCVRSGIVTVLRNAEVKDGTVL